MRKNNNGIGESNIVQSNFASYLVIAMRRKKNDYLRSKTKVQQNEQSLEEILEDNEALLIEPDISLELPLMEQLENIRLYKALKKAKTKDLYILFAKVLENRSFAEIAAELGVKLSTVAMTYYRFIEHLKNEIGGESE
jgi:RNA polymerase sigma factor (sigma-70 family)